MKYTDVTDLLAKESNTHAEDWFLVSRARYGMELVFQALADTHGVGEIITQPFTCVTAINPILATGHKPLYADIEPDTLSADPTSVAKMIGAETRAVIVQHSFGILAPLAVMHGLARKSGVIVIEDAAHRPATPILNSDGHVVADVVVCSFGAEKMYRTRFGGAIYLNPQMTDRAVYEASKNLLTALAKPASYDRIRERLYPLFNAVLYRLPRAIASPLRTILLRVRILRSPIVPLETAGFQAELPALPSAYGLGRIYNELGDRASIADRTERVRTLQSVFHNPDNTYTVPAGVYGADQPLVRFPLLARDAAQASAVFDRISQLGYYAGKWYRPLLFPGVTSYDTYHYTIGSCPVAEDIAARIVNIPTNVSIPTNHLEEIRHAFTT